MHPCTMAYLRHRSLKAPLYGVELKTLWTSKILSMPSLVKILSLWVVYLKQGSTWLVHTESSFTSATRSSFYLHILLSASSTLPLSLLPIFHFYEVRSLRNPELVHVRLRPKSETILQNLHGLHLCFSIYLNSKNNATPQRDVINTHASMILMGFLATKRPHLKLSLQW